MNRLNTMSRFDMSEDAPQAQEQEVVIELRIKAKIPVNCIPEDTERETEEIMKNRKTLADVLDYIDENQEIDWDFY